MKKVVVVDVDGTITNFYDIDHEIIPSIYNRKIVLWLDKMLWKINSLDIITNNYALFKLRMLIYSFLNGHSYKKDILKYKKMYEKKARAYFGSFLNEGYKLLKHRGYDIIILTCDPFDAYVENRAIISQNKPRYVIDNIPSKYDEVNIIGNNFMDDIKSGLKLKRKFPIKVNVYYVGSSKLIKKRLKNKEVKFCSCLKDAIKQIK